MKHSYAIYDVFTREKLAGNPLAIVFGAADLADEDMQRIAREFNLSESVFVLPADHERHSARIRIFTPRFEMPFAGHPTVGTAIALAGPIDAANDAENARIIVLEENIGPVRCLVRVHDSVPFAEFSVPRLPERIPFTAGREAIAAALGIGHHEIGFENHVPTVWSAGVPYVCVPMSGLDAIGRATLDATAWHDIAPNRGNGVPASAYLYCRETVLAQSRFHARMFVAAQNPYEDPATGSAAAAFSGAIVHFDDPVDGQHGCWIEQGMEMGRPSQIRIELDLAGGSLAAVRIGGHAVRVAEGTIEI